MTPATTAPAQPILRVEGVGKRFLSVVALDDVSIAVSPGEVHVVVGETGAGKTTLTKILSGSLRPDCGHIFVDGQEVTFTEPADAYRHGIAATSEKGSLVANMNVVENILLQRLPPHRFPLLRMMGVVDWTQATKIVEPIFEFLDADISLRKKAWRLGLAEQQFVEIAKALSRHPRVLIFDEPVSALSEIESVRVFSAIRKLASQGVAVIYASHRLEDISHIADRVTVLKWGKVLASLPAKEVNTRSIVEMLVAEATQAAALREADRLRYEFVSLVSHELRTPLAAIKGHATTLLRRQWPEDIQRECLTTIDEECNRLRELIDNVLDISRIERGVLRIEKEAMSVAAVAERVIEQVRKENVRHRIVSGFPPGLPMVDADPRRVKQVFDNLLGNAVKYSPGGGTITVTADRQQDEVIVVVGDDGIGIGEEHQEKIFERFYRVPNRSIGNVGGSGLGLAICKGIVEAHGGRIWVRSIPGQGSTFGFSLPVYRACEGNGDVPVSEDSVAAGGRA